MKRLLAALSAALLAVGLTAAPAVAAPPAAASGEIIYIDPTGAGAYPLADVAADWSKNTDITVIVAPCTGDNCIHITTVAMPCDGSTGTVVIGFRGGCARGYDDDANAATPRSCLVEMNATLLDTTRSGYDYNLLLYVTKHEVGHCIYWFGGAGFIHLDSKNALMKDGLAGYPRDSQTRLTSEDRAFARSLF